MRALMLQDTIGPEGLELREVDEPSPTPDQVVIDVRAAGVGFVDLLVTHGRYQIRPPTPFVPGIEVAGVVRSAPEGSGLTAGQRVAATTPFGAWAEVAATPAFLAFPLPDGVSDEAAAGMVVNYQTAHLGLKRRGRLATGETVLVHGAAGGVGTASIQVAKALGAGRVIGVARGEVKAQIARDAGADDVLEAEGDWVAGVRELTGGRGADVVVDPVGGDRLALSLKCMAPEGRLLVIGFADGRIPTLEVNRLLLRHLDVIGVNFGGMLPFDPEFARRAWADLADWLERGLLRPVVGAVHPLADGAQALAGYADRTAVGKPVLIVENGS